MGPSPLPISSFELVRLIRLLMTLLLLLSLFWIIVVAIVDALLRFDVIGVADSMSSTKFDGKTPTRAPSFPFHQPSST